MKKLSTMLTTAALFLTTVAAAGANEQLNINILMPTLTCGQGVLEPDQCILSGRLMATGSATINGTVRFYCNLRYQYVAAGSEQQAIRFTNRALFHGEVEMQNGRGRKELNEQLTLKLSSRPRQVEVLEVGCEKE